MPTFRRPDRLAQALASIAPTGTLPPGVEVLVTDNTQEPALRSANEEVVRAAGFAVLHANPAGLGMVGNFNECVRLASGEHVLILHDDDRLLPDAVVSIHTALTIHPGHARRFGVEVVDNTGRRRRRQVADTLEHLSPAEAVRRLITHSSYIRFPSMVVSAEAYERASRDHPDGSRGPFDPAFGGACDLDAWVRICAGEGLTLEPSTTAEYVVHPDADTENTFTLATLERIDRVFAQVDASGLLPAPELQRARARFLLQFTIAGAMRAVRRRDGDEALRRLSLVDDVQPALPPAPLGWRALGLAASSVARATRHLPR